MLNPIEIIDVREQWLEKDVAEVYVNETMVGVMIRDMTTLKIRFQPFAKFYALTDYVSMPDSYAGHARLNAIEHGYREWLNDLAEQKMRGN